MRHFCSDSSGIILHQIPNFRGSARPGPLWGSLQRSPNSLAGGKGARCHLPKNHTLLLVLWVSEDSSSLKKVKVTCSS